MKKEKFQNNKGPRQALATIPLGGEINSGEILSSGAWSPKAFVHRALNFLSGADNPHGLTGNVDITMLYATRLNHPYLNGNPTAILSVTQTSGHINEEKRELVLNELLQPPMLRPIGVFYLRQDQHWYIYNLDISIMEHDRIFNVVIEEDWDHSV